jgi:hypothetical protein
MVMIGYALVMLGFVMAFYWQLRFLVVAYSQSALWFFGCLFVPFVDWVFLFLNFKATRKAFALSLVGLAAVALGSWMAGIVWAD